MIKKILLNSIRVYKNRSPIYDQDGGKMAKIYTLFMSKTGEKPYPLGPHIPIQPIQGSTPPPGGLEIITFSQQEKFPRQPLVITCFIRSGQPARLVIDKTLTIFR